MNLKKKKATAQLPEGPRKIHHKMIVLATMSVSIPKGFSTALLIPKENWSIKTGDL